MNSKKFSEAMSEIDGKYIEDAINYKKKARKPRWIKWGAMAACLFLLIAAIPLLMQISGPPQKGPDDTMDGLPHLIVDGRKFFISSHLSVTDELPDGFAKAGTADVEGFENCPYYLNPDIPEWVYVCHEVRTDGTSDYTGTISETEPYDSYVRYVDERLRGKYLLCHNGELYISIWSADHFGENPDITEEYYYEMKAKYGLRIEGSEPDGFVPAGTAEFTGYDTIPTGTLSCNKEAAEVFYNPDEPDVLLMAAHWFTAAGEEGNETRHDGFDVYIRYDCPLNKN